MYQCDLRLTRAVWMYQRLVEQCGRLYWQLLQLLITGPGHSTHRPQRSCFYPVRSRGIKGVVYVLDPIKYPYIYPPLTPPPGLRGFGESIVWGEAVPVMPSIFRRVTSR
jgi:hypothetical protein